MPVEIPTFDAPEKYERYAINVEGHSPEKAQEARRQAVKLRATRDGAKTDVERECLEAIYAYVWTLFKKHRKRQRASYTWRMVDKRGMQQPVAGRSPNFWPPRRRPGPFEYRGVGAPTSTRVRQDRKEWM
jgi:hypothetical protein